MLYAPISRRKLLKSTGLLGISGSVVSIQACADSHGQTNLSLYLSVESKQLTFHLPKCEMGQDVMTSFAMMIAEELNLPLSMIGVKTADANPEIPNQITVGSASISTNWQLMRQLGANTKTLILKQAADLHKRPLSDFYIENGLVKSQDHSIEIEDLIKNLRVPTQIDDAPLKAAADYTLIGTDTRSVHIEEKCTGRYHFLSDTRDTTDALTIVSVAFKEDWPRPNLDTLLQLKQQYGLLHAFSVSAQIGSFSHRIFLAARKTWPLLKAKDALEQWKRDALQQRKNINTSPFETLQQKLYEAHSVDDEHISLIFETPALCHAPMETPAASMQFNDPEALEVWAPTQAPDHVQRAIAERVALPLESVTVHTVPMGGAFGRKRYTDYLEELAEATKHLFEQNIRDKTTLIWTREDDMSSEFYRPATLQHVEWNNASPQQLSLKLYEGFSEAKHSEPRNIETDLPLNLSIDGSKVALKHHFSVGIWRSVHHGYHAFALCSTVDEMCIQTQTTPTAFYLEHAKQASLVERVKATFTDTPSISSRLRRVITNAVQLADEDNTSANNTARGFAAYSVFGSHIAILSEVNLNDTQLKVTRVWAAVDCGLAINPDKIKAQIEGGILYGLSACLYGDMPRDKDSQALNFDVLPVLRMVDAPDIKINVVESQEAPTGAGELGVPVIAPAICNAIRRLTPYRFTRLPLLKEGRLNFDHAMKIEKS